MSEIKHTPLPWKHSYGQWSRVEVLEPINPIDGHHVRIGEIHKFDDAEFIVKAVNEYQRMVEDTKDFAIEVNDLKEKNEKLTKRVEVLKKVLKLTKEFLEEQTPLKTKELYKIVREVLSEARK